MKHIISLFLLYILFIIADTFIQVIPDAEMWLFTRHRALMDYPLMLTLYGMIMSIYSLMWVNSSSPNSSIIRLISFGFTLLLILLLGSALLKSRTLVSLCLFSLFLCLVLKYYLSQGFDFYTSLLTSFVIFPALYYFAVFIIGILNIDIPRHSGEIIVVVLAYIIVLLTIFPFRVVKIINHLKTKKTAQ